MKTMDLFPGEGLDLDFEFGRDVSAWTITGEMLAGGITVATLSVTRPSLTSARVTTSGPQSRAVEGRQVIVRCNATDPTRPTIPVVEEVRVNVALETTTSTPPATVNAHVTGTILVEGAATFVDDVTVGGTLNVDQIRITGVALPQTLPAETAGRVAGDQAVLAAFGAADAAIIASGAEPANVQLAPVISTGTTQARTVQDRFAEVVNVKDFGAIGDGVTDDLAAIQAAIDYAHGPIVDASIRRNQRMVYFPRAADQTGYKISAPIKVYSGTYLKGDGFGTIIREVVGGFTGTALIQGALWAGDTSGYLTEVVIEGFGLGGPTTPTGIWGINLSGASDECATITQCRIDDITFRSPCGLRASTYAQFCRFNYLRWPGSGAPIERMIWLRGNANWIDGVDKEGSCGTCTDPLVLVEHNLADGPFSNFSMLRMTNVVFDGPGYTGQGTMRFVGGGDGGGFIGYGNNLYIENVWFEQQGPPDYAISFQNITNFEVRGISGPISVGQCGGIDLVRSIGRFDAIELSTADNPLETFLTLDAFSSVTVGDVFSASGRSPTVDHRYRVLRHHTYFKNWPDSEATDALACTEIDQQSDQNILVNGSFEAGMYGWMYEQEQYNFYLHTEESEIASGKMIVIPGPNPAPAHKLVQEIIVRTEDVGQPFTFAAQVRVVGSTGAVEPYVEGSVTFNGTSGADGVLYADDKWHTVTAGFIPQAAGVIKVGLYFSTDDGVTFYVDEARVSRGSVPRLAGFGTKQLELGGTSLANAWGPPTLGTWKVGDTVLNSQPVSGTAMGWICTVAGEIGDASWGASTAYSARARCSNGGNSYVCTVAGTSAGSGGPTGMGTGITDGGVTWNYVGPSGQFNDLPTVGSATDLGKNLIKWSEDFSNAAWQKVGSGAAAPTVTANAADDPHGELRADKIEFPAVGAAQRAIVNQGFTTASGSTTFSVYLRADSPCTIYLWDVGRLSVSCSVTTSWQRFSISYAEALGSTYMYLGFDTGAGGAPSPVTGTTAGVTVYAWGAQVDPVGTVGVYRKTTSSIAP